jgi:hypothetical protein
VTTENDLAAYIILLIHWKQGNLVHAVENSFHPIQWALFTLLSSSKSNFAEHTVNTAHPAPLQMVLEAFL